jgi:hypothetical protein
MKQESGEPAEKLYNKKTGRDFHPPGSSELRTPAGV